MITASYMYKQQLTIMNIKVTPKITFKLKSKKKTISEFIKNFN